MHAAYNYIYRERGRHACSIGREGGMHAAYNIFMSYTFNSHQYYTAMHGVLIMLWPTSSNATMTLTIDHQATPLMRPAS